MNTEIFDYLKTLSKKEFFFVNFSNVVLSLVIIISAIITLNSGATIMIYAIMFGSSTLLLTLNSYKCFKRKSKNGWVFAVLAVAFAVITGIAIIALAKGGV